MPVGVNRWGENQKGQTPEHHNRQLETRVKRYFLWIPVQHSPRYTSRMLSQMSLIIYLNYPEIIQNVFAYQVTVNYIETKTVLTVERVFRAE